MASADGSILIRTDVDAKKATAELTKINSKIRDIESEIDKLNAKKVELRVQSGEISAKLDAAKADLAMMSDKGSGYTKEEISSQKEEVKRLQSEYDSVERTIDSIDKKMEKYNESLDSSKEKAAELNTEISASKTPMAKMANAADEVDKRFDKITKRIIGLAKRVFFFSLITAGLRSLRSWMSNVINTSDEAKNAVARLKGALLTLAQPLVNVVIPAFIQLVNVLTKVVLAIAQFMSFIFGTTLSQSAKDAEALSKSMDDTAGSAKEAKKQLAGFDELNVLSDNKSGGGSSSSSSPLFDFEVQEDEGLMKKILGIVEAIGAAILAWKIGSAFGLSLQQMLGLFMAIYGAIQFVKTYFDAWVNGVSFEKLNELILWLTVTVTGLYIAFGSTAAAIGLVVGGIALLVLGIKDAMQNGANWANVLTMITGILAAGIGIAVLTGSWIPLLIAGILAVILAFTQWAGTTDQLIGNIKQIFWGLIQFVKGVFTGDWKMAWEGVKNVFKGIVNTMLTIIGSFVNVAIKGINWLIDMINKINIKIPDWIPSVGGKSWSPNLSRVSSWTIPQLANGAVVPPNREFMAMLGDNKKETEIVSPLSTMKQAFLEALRESGGGNGQSIKVYLDGKQIAQNQVRYLKNIERANG